MKVAAFDINIKEGDTILYVGFGQPATNSEIVKDAAERIAEIKAAGGLQGGPLLKINGPASLPCAFVLGHAVHT
jgi:CRISPR-associated protein Csx3